MKCLAMWGSRMAYPAFLVAALSVPGTLLAEEPVTADMTAQPLPAIMADRLHKATMVDIAQAGDRLVAVGDYGVIQVSEDNGASWSQVAGVPVSRMINRVVFINEKVGYAVGYDQVILRTEDGGLSWTLKNFSADPGWPLFDVFFLDEQRGFVVGERGTFMSTTDGGESWSDMESPLSDLGMHLNDIIKLNSGCLLMVGEKGIIASSTDDGASWRLLQTPYVGSWFGAKPYGEQGAIMYGLRGNVYVIDDVYKLIVEDIDEFDEYGRETVEDNAILAQYGWTRLDNDRVDSFFGGAQLDNEEIVLVGVNGAVMRTDLSAGKMESIENPEGYQLGNALLVGGNLVTVGVGGIKQIPYR